jgi:2-amino-4,5-dihydroxy-6-oxo-7-(phosphonooxy)heptanoate synthase
MDRLVGQLADAGVDAVILHKGTLRRIRPARFASMSLIVHLSASTVHAPDPDAKFLVTDVAEALRLGADAVSVHVNLGSLTESTQIQDLGNVARQCDRWNVPLVAMVYPRGPDICEPTDPALVAHAAILAADLGADLVKTPYVGSVDQMRQVTAACPIPLITAGGARFGSDDAVLSLIRAARASGAAGVAIGRNIFQAADPGAVAGLAARLVHQAPEEHLEYPRGALANGHHEAVLA